MRSRLSRASIPPREALAVARALLRHPPRKVETGTPEGEWLDKLASLVRRVALGQKEQHSRATNGEPSARSPAPVASTAGGSDLRSKLNDLRVHEDARTIQERR